MKCLSEAWRYRIDTRLERTTGESFEGIDVASARLGDHVSTEIGRGPVAVVSRSDECPADRFLVEALGIVAALDTLHIGGRNPEPR